MFELFSVYYSKSDKTVLHDISLRLSPGKIYAVLGLNGSGKTTLLKVLSQFGLILLELSDGAGRISD
jgi:ABC-type multidrug transport system ATPase subunit